VRKVLFHHSSSLAYSSSISADFGVSRFKDIWGVDETQKTMTQQVGSLCWMAPESMSRTTTVRYHFVFSLSLSLSHLQTLLCVCSVGSFGEALRWQSRRVFIWHQYVVTLPRFGCWLLTADCLSTTCGTLQSCGRLSLATCRTVTNDPSSLPRP